MSISFMYEKTSNKPLCNHVTNCSLTETENLVAGGLGVEKMFTQLCHNKQINCLSMISKLSFTRFNQLYYNKHINCWTCWTSAFVGTTTTTTAAVPIFAPKKLCKMLP